MGKKFKSVQDMVKSLSEDKEFDQQLAAQVNNRRLSRFLFVLRNQKGMTQKQMAEKLGCTQSRISKIEHAEDMDLTVKDLLDYGKVLDMNINFNFAPRKLKIVDLIRFHLDAIHQLIKRLVNLSGDDDQMGLGVLKAMRNTTDTFAGNLLSNLKELIASQAKSNRFKKERFTVSEISEYFEEQDQKEEKDLVEK